MASARQVTFPVRPRSTLRGHGCAYHLVGANRVHRGGAEEQLRYKHIPQSGSRQNSCLAASSEVICVLSAVQLASMRRGMFAR